MAKSAFILGGTGQIGRAAAVALAAGGWDVALGARTRPDDLDFRFVPVNRTEGLELDRDYDVLVDVIAMSAQHADQVVALDGRIGSVVAISSASVYADADGRTLDEASDAESFPRFAVPIPEDHPTVAPGDATYSTRKRAMELAFAERDELHATVLRPCAIHGRGGKSHIREWFFAKRILDARRVVLLAYGGESRFHTTSAPNLAELIRLAAETPGRRTLNAGDADPPTVLEIGRSIQDVFDATLAEVLLRGGSDVGRNPWAVPRPLVVDMRAAEAELGYRPVTTYEEAVVDTVRWLADERPPLGEYMSTFFDYDAEDRFLAELAP